MSMTTLVPRSYAERLQDQLDCALQIIAAFTNPETDFWARQMKAELLEPANQATLEKILCSHGYHKNTHSGFCLGGLEKVLPNYRAVGDATEALRQVLDSYLEGALSLPEDLDEFVEVLPAVVKARAAASQKYAEVDPDAAGVVQRRNEAAIDWLLDEKETGPGVAFYLEAYMLRNRRNRTSGKGEGANEHE